MSKNSRLASAFRHSGLGRAIDDASPYCFASAIALDLLGVTVTTDQPLSPGQHAEAEAMERLSEAGFRCTNLSDDPNDAIPTTLAFLRTGPGFVDMAWIALDLGALSTAARYNPANAPTTTDDDSGGEMLPALRQVAPAPLLDVAAEVLTWPEAEAP
jgi:hypothetical protein